MHWLIQDNENIAPNSDNIIDACQQLGVLYTLVQYPGEMPKVKRGFPYGSVKYVLNSDDCEYNYVCHLPSWSNQAEAWGQHLLNHDARACLFRSVQETERFFIKPEVLEKAFSGVCCTWAEYCRWRDQILAGDTSGYYGLTPDTDVLYAPVKPIEAEYRFFVIDKQVVTGSLYRADGMRRVLPFFDSPWYRDDVLRFAQDRVNEWDFEDYTLDLAISNGQIKILETNYLQCSGLYACDAVKIVAAIEARTWHP